MFANGRTAIAGGFVDIAGAGGETRTPNIQTRSLNGWNSKDKQK